MVNFCSHTLQDFCKAKPTGNAPSPAQQHMQTSWHDQCGKLALKSEPGNCCFIAKARTFGTSARWHRWCTKPPCRAITVSTFKVHAWNLKNSESKLIVSSRHPSAFQNCHVHISVVFESVVNPQSRQFRLPPHPVKTVAIPTTMSSASSASPASRCTGEM
jgi:hypothetical protein